jgi:hypothetical protein
MKQFMVTMMAIAAVVAANSVWASQPTQDPTKYDCRVTVRTERHFQPGSKVPLVRFVKECPHKDKMAAGLCESSWLWGMRCKE